MRYTLTTIFVGAVVTFAGPAAAAPPPPPPTADPYVQQQPADVDVDERELVTFAEIYVDMQEARAELQAGMANAGSPEEAQQIQQSMERQLVTIIEEHGWTLDKYNAVTDAINRDPELRETAVQLINERS